MQSPLRLDDLFGEGVLVRARDYDLVSLLRGHRVGEIAVSSGSLVIADAYGLDAAAPLDVALPEGTYPVIIGTSEMDAGHDVTGMLVRLADAPVAAWRSLLPDGESLGVDGAAIAITDAATQEALRGAGRDRWFERLADFGGTLGAEILGEPAGPIAACHLGSDGGYPLWGGFDDRDRLVAIAVTTTDPADYLRWPAPGSKVLPVDATSLEACLAWAHLLGGDEAVVREGALDPATIDARIAIAGRPLPPDLAHYYATHTPWRDDDVDLDTFREAVAQHDLKGAFPITVSGVDALVIQRPDAVVDLYEGSTLGTSLDLRAWVLLSTIAVHDLRKL